MNEVGVVKEISGNKAIVSVQRQSACDSCPGGSVCKLVDSEAQIEAINEIGADIGDTVQVNFKPHTYLKGTILVYGIPAIMLIIGAIVGKEFLSKIFIKNDPDLLSAICGFGLFILSIFFMKAISKRLEKKKEYIPVIDSIISSHK